MANTQGLSETFRKFLDAYCEFGTIARAAEVSGVSPSHGHYILNRPSVQAALILEVKRRLLAAAPMAMRTMITLAESAVSERIRKEAAKDILDRAGFGTPKAREREEGAELTLTEMTIDQLKDLAGKLEDEISGRAKVVNAPANTDKATQATDILE